VQAGDTLGTIAEQFGVTVSSIMEANAIADETAISLDQILVIKGVDPALVGAAPVSNPQAESPIGYRMTMPLPGACLPRDDGQMPNSPREYRHGIHEGVDFFTGFACIDVPIGMPVLAPYDGVVVRSDQEYKQLTQKQIDDLLALVAAQGFTDAGTLDKLRGRQVWIDHGDGIQTRYAHLSDIPLDVQVGTPVTQGQTIGFVGDSGTPESLGQEGYNKHLHFEIRVDDTYLAAGLSPEETRAQYEALFGFR
jgi:peptidoglycan LD-endopeptidase LytH